MKNIYILLLAMLYSGITYSQVIVEQGFDSNVPASEWVYTAQPVEYEVGTDIWGPVETMSTITPLNGDRFFGMRDLNNTNGGGSDEQILSFASVNVAGQLDVVASFSYFTRNWDSTDTLKYEFFVDGVSQGKSESLDKDSEAWTKIEFAVPEGSTEVSLTIYAKQDGGTDYGGLDEFKVEAGVIAEPNLSLTGINLDYKNGAMEGNNVTFSLNLANFNLSSSASAADGDGYIEWSYGNETPTQQFNSDDITFTAPDPGRYQLVVNLIGNDGENILSETADFWVTKIFTVPFTNNFEYGTEAGFLL